MLKLLLRGYSERHQQEELFLHEALRHSESDDDFKDICIVLGRAAGLFSVPTLMAFVREKSSFKAIHAQNAIEQIRVRVIERDDPEMKDFFTLSFWQPRWVGTKEQFISYTACIAMLFQSDTFFEDNLLDSTGEKLMNEIEVDISPYLTFREMRLCTSGWEAKEDIVRVLEEIKQDILVQTVMIDGSISKSPEALYQENLINMRCDFLLTRLNFDLEYGSFHYLLKNAQQLNQPEH